MKVFLVSASSKRDHGRKAQLSNIRAATTMAETIRTTLGPLARVKLLLDPMGGVVFTSDGNAILREINVGHPAAKTLIELSRAQDEEIGDGTTSVVLLAGELLQQVEPLFDRDMHPTRIVSGLLKGLEDSLEMLDEIATTVNASNPKEIYDTIATCLGTKFSSSYGDLLPKLALDSVSLVNEELPNGMKDIAIKKYVRIEKIPGGEINQSSVVHGIVLNKDVTHPKMKRRIVNPRVVLLDSPLEYKKGESQTNVEIMEESHWEQLLKQEEDEVKKMCDDIIKIGCDVVVTEKGVSDLAQHFFAKAGISVLRRVKKSDNNRLARVTGATIVSRASDIRPEDVGHDCGLFEIKKISDEYYSYFIECQHPKACTVLLRGGSKDTLNEIERNLHDALNVTRCLFLKPKILPGGGATEMELSVRLAEKSSSIAGVQKWAYEAVGKALEIIPKLLLDNCGADTIRVFTELKSKHSKPGNSLLGINGHTGEIVDVSTEKIWDTFSTKQQVIKAAVEAAAMLIRVDDILSATSGKKSQEEAGGQAAAAAPPQSQVADM